jgi:hypothetical protein
MSSAGWYFEAVYYFSFKSIKYQHDPLKPNLPEQQKSNSIDQMIYNMKVLFDLLFNLTKSTKKDSSIKFFSLHWSWNSSVFQTYEYLFKDYWVKLFSRKNLLPWRPLSDKHEDCLISLELIFQRRENLNLFRQN